VGQSGVMEQHKSVNISEKRRDRGRKSYYGRPIGNIHAL